MFSGLPRHYDRVAALFSFGQDPRWRSAMVGAVQAAPDARVLDVATEGKSTRTGIPGVFAAGDGRDAPDSSAVPS